MHTFTFDDFPVGEVTVRVEVGLVQVDPGLPPTHNDPGHPPEWEIHEVNLYSDDCCVVTMSETEFINDYPGAQDIINNAYEEAASQ